MNYEDIVSAYSDAKDDLLQEMIGYIDPNTRLKVPGIFDKLLAKINFEALADDPEAETSKLVEKLTYAYSYYLRQNAILAREFAKLLRS